MHVLRLLERLQAFLSELAPETRLFHAAEGACVVVRQRVVEPDRAGLDLAHAAEDRVEILRVHVAAEAEAGRVGELDRLVEARDRHERGDRAEGLLAEQVGLRRSARDDRRRVEVALARAGAVAAGEELRAGLDRRVDLGRNLLALACRNEWPDVGGRIERVAELERVRVVDEGRGEVVEHRLEDVEALGRGADLARVQEGRPGAALGRDLDVLGDVLADDERILAAQLEVDARDAFGADDGDPLARVDGAGECDAVDPVVADDPLADLARAGEQVDDAGGEVVEAVGEGQRRERRQLGGLADDRVPGRESGRELPREEQQRVVPRHDAGDDAHRLLQHQGELRRLDRRDHAAGEVAAHLRVVVERGGRPADLVGVLDQRLAALERHQPRELVRAVAQPRGDLVQELGPLDGRHAAPVAGRLACRGDRGVDLLVRRQLDRGDRLLRVRVLDVEPLAVPRHLLAADQQARLGQSIFAITCLIWV